jgi:hypothetical protein
LGIPFTFYDASVPPALVSVTPAGLPLRHSRRQPRPAWRRPGHLPSLQQCPWPSAPQLAVPRQGPSRRSAALLAGPPRPRPRPRLPLPPCPGLPPCAPPPPPPSRPPLAS